MKNKIVLWKKGKKFEVKIIDNTGDFIIIDNDFISKKILSLSDYLKIPKVIEILNSDDITKFSLQ